MLLEERSLNVRKGVGHEKQTHCVLGQVSPSDAMFLSRHLDRGREARRHVASHVIYGRRGAHLPAEDSEHSTHWVVHLRGQPAFELPASHSAFRT